MNTASSEEPSVKAENAGYILLARQHQWKVKKGQHFPVKNTHQNWQRIFDLKYCLYPFPQILFDLLSISSIIWLDLRFSVFTVLFLLLLGSQILHAVSLKSKEDWSQRIALTLAVEKVKITTVRFKSPFLVYDGQTLTKTNLLPLDTVFWNEPHQIVSF